MSPETPDGADPGGRPRTQRFRRAPNAVLLTREQVRRQGRIAQLAWELLDNREDVIGFLNTYDAELGGRSLDVAVDSDEGLARVEGTMRTRAEKRGRRLLEDAGIV